MFDMSHLPWKAKSGAVTLEGDERLIDTFSTHWIKYSVPVLLYIIIGITSIFLLLLARTALESMPFVAHLSFLLGTILLTLVHHWFFHRILSEGMVDVIITNKRLILLQDSLWFYDNMHEVSIALIRGVEARKQGILSNLLRYGSLWFDTGGSDTESSVIPLVPHPHRKVREITQMLKLR